jgi:hypothetical protein
VCKIRFADITFTYENHLGTGIGNNGSRRLANENLRIELPQVNYTIERCPETTNFVRSTGVGTDRSKDRQTGMKGEARWPVVGSWLGN